MRKYSKELIDVILDELRSGKSIAELSEKYSVDRRRISEWKNNPNNKVEVIVNNTSENKPELEKKLTNSSKEEVTIEDVMNRNGISPSEWEVSNATINGWTDSKGNEHHQTKLNVVKKKISLEFEIPSPINITLTKSITGKIKKTNDLKCAVILSDMQTGFKRNPDNGSLVAIHDREAISVAKGLCQYLNPDRVVFLGDNLDFAEFSTKYVTPAEFYFTTQPSLVELSWWLGQFKESVPNAKFDYLLGNHECFSEDTEILTEKGWLKYWEVNPSIKLATFNKNTLEIDYQNYIEKQEYNFSGEMFSITSSLIDLLITPNHRIYWANGNQNNKFNMYKIKDVGLNNSRKIQYASGNNNKIDYDISDDMIRLIAWIITDGSTRNDSIFLYQRKEKVHLIENILNNLNIEYTMTSRIRDIKEICGKKLKNNSKEQCTIYINKTNSKEIYKHISEKYILPSWIYELSERQVDIFISSMVDGDGSRKKDCKTCMMLYGIKSVLDQVQKLLVANGYRSSIYTYRERQYRLNITKTNFNTLDRIKNHINKVLYVGKVWDFTVPNDTLVVRRNGKISITGNCRLEKYINSKVISLANLKNVNDMQGYPVMSVPNLLNLEKLGISYHNYPQGKLALNSNLVCIHGETAKGQSGATVSEVVKSARVSTIQGHIHRHEIATKTVWDAFDNYYMYTAASFGCLCKIDPGFVPGMKYRQNWQNGIGVVWYEDTGLEQFQLQFVPIIQGRAIYNGEIFESLDESEIIREIENNTNYKVS